MNVVINPHRIDGIVPIDGENNSVVYIGQVRVTLSNDALNAIFEHGQVTLLNVDEPQIPGVSDNDIVDATETQQIRNVTNDDIIDASGEGEAV